MRQEDHKESLVRQLGYTLVEVIFASSILVMMLTGIVTTLRIVSSTTIEVESRAQVDEIVHKTMQQISEIARGSSKSTIQLMSNNVNGEGQSPSEASWTSPVSSATYDGIRSDGAGSKSVSIFFVMDSMETDNGKDDDADGLVDEGTLYRSSSGGKPVAIARNIESFKVVFADGAMTVTMTCAVGKRSNGSKIKRVQVVQTFQLRDV